MTHSSESASDTQWWLQKGLVASRGGDRAKACHCFRLALRADPDNILALLWLARLVPDRQERLALFSRVLELDPDNDQA